MPVFGVACRVAVAWQMASLGEIVTLVTISMILLAYLNHLRRSMGEDLIVIVT